MALARRKVDPDPLLIAAPIGNVWDGVEEQAEAVQVPGEVAEVVDLDECPGAVNMCEVAISNDSQGIRERIMVAVLKSPAVATFTCGGAVDTAASVKIIEEFANAAIKWVQATR